MRPKTSDKLSISIMSNKQLSHTIVFNNISIYISYMMNYQHIGGCVGQIKITEDIYNS